MPGTSMEKRLQNILAHAGVASRRSAGELIEAGKVKVDGKTVREKGLRVDPEDTRLHELLHRIQLRRTPVLPFLARSNPLNYSLGYVRHHILRLIEK